MPLFGSNEAHGYPLYFRMEFIFLKLILTPKESPDGDFLSQAKILADRTSGNTMQLLAGFKWTVSVLFPRFSSFFLRFF
jgi:hypothetical protein